jgi:hypothetical protein
MGRIKGEEVGEKRGTGRAQGCSQLILASGAELQPFSRFLSRTVGEWGWA